MRFCFEQSVAAPREVVFALHADPGNLAVLYRESRAFRLIRHEGNVRPGSRTWVEVTVAAILPVVLGFEHTNYEPPHRFGERLIHGPFSRFDHVHAFEAVAGGTVVRDRLDIELPWCYGGERCMKLMLGPLVREAFAFRHAALVKLANSGSLSCTTTTTTRAPHT